MYSTVNTTFICVAEVVLHCKDDTYNRVFAQTYICFQISVSSYYLAISEDPVPGPW